jgi:hypothetical protein
MDENNLPEQIRLARANVRKQEEAELVRHMVDSVTVFSPSAEQVCTWLLGAAGASAALFLPNLAEVSALIGSTGARTCLGFLVISVFAGLIAKRLGMLVQFQRTIMDTMLSSMPRIYDQFTHLYAAIAPDVAHIGRANPKVILDAMLKAAPWFIRWRVRKGQAMGAKDMTMTYRQALSRFGWQMILVQVQWFAFAAAILVAAIYV